MAWLYVLCTQVQSNVNIGNLMIILLLKCHQRDFHGVTTTRTVVVAVAAAASWQRVVRESLRKSRASSIV
jgi:hypothetical protein